MTCWSILVRIVSGTDGLALLRHRRTFLRKESTPDEVLVYKPNTFKMLRAFWNVSFIKLGDEENESLKEILLLRHQQEMRTGQCVWERNEEIHDLIGAHELDRYLIKPESLLCNCVRADRVKHEMALEVSVVYDLCNEGNPESWADGIMCPIKW